MVDKYISKKEKFERLGKKIKQRKIKKKYMKDASDENENFNSISNYVYKMILDQENE